MVIRAGRKGPEVLFGFVVNIVVPVVVLLRLSGEAQLGPTKALVLALAFPLGFGLYDLIVRRQYNFLSIIGFVGVVLTGGIGLSGLAPQWLAVKEAAVPLVIGLVIIFSRKTRWPVITKILEAVIDDTHVRQALDESNNIEAYELRLTRVTYLIAGSFFLSAVLNYLLARYIVVSDPGTTAFNEELGKLTALSYPIVALPSLIVMWAAIIWLVRGVQQLTGLSLKQIFRLN